MATDFFAKLLIIPATIAILVLALLANENAALSGKYDGADQFIYSVMSR